MTLMNLKIPRGVTAIVFVLASSQAEANCPLIAGNLPATPDSNFTLNAGGLTALDIQSQLTWSRCLEGGCATPSTMTREQAETAADNSILGGFTDWRLPTRNELVSLVETGCSQPAINTAVFTQSTPSSVWSSTNGPTGTAWYVDFSFGWDEIENAQTSKAVRLVRSDAPLFANGFE